MLITFSKIPNRPTANRTCCSITDVSTRSTGKNNLKFGKNLSKENSLTSRIYNGIKQVTSNPWPLIGAILGSAIVALFTGGILAPAAFIVIMSAAVSVDFLWGFFKNK